jgi:hypothetical protein
VDIAVVPNAVAWTVANAGGAGDLRGVRNDAMPAIDLYLGGESSGPLGSDGQGTFFWAHAGGLRSYRVLPPFYRDVLAEPGPITGITADSSYVFWTTWNGGVYRASADGTSGATEISRTPILGTGTGTRILVAGNNVYWSAGARGYRTGLNGGAQEMVASWATNAVVDFAVSSTDGKVYWLADSGPNGTVRMQVIGGASSTSLAEPTLFSSFGGLVVTSPNQLFFTADAGLYRLDGLVGASTPTKVADLQAPVGRLAYTAAYIYYIHGGGREVGRIPRQ